MELWMKIGMAVFFGFMLIWWWPGLNSMIKNSRKAEKGEWASVVFILGIVVLIVALLMWSVSG